MSETALAFLLTFTLAIAAALFVRPIYGLYAYVGVFYAHPPSRWWGAALPDMRWSLMAALVTLVALAIHRNRLAPQREWTKSAVIALLIAYTLWMWIQVPWVVSPYHLEGAVLFAKYLLLTFLVYTILDNEKDFLGFCLAHVIGCAYFGWLVYLAPDSGRLEGVGGPGVDDANTLGMHLSTGLIFASFLLLTLKGWRRWLILLAVPLILNGIIQTETRGAFVGLLAGGLATVYLKPKKFRKRYYVLAVSAVIGFLALANESFLARMESLTAAVDADQEWDSSSQSRIELAKAQLRMFVDYPLGAGHQGTAYLSRQYLEDRWLASNSGDRASHNTAMTVLVDQGLPGVLLFAALAVVVIRTLRRLKAMDAQGLPDDLGWHRTMIGGALVTIVASGMFAQYFKAEVQIWCLVLLAVLWDLAAKTRRDLASAQPENGAPDAHAVGRPSRRSLT